MYASKYVVNKCVRLELSTEHTNEKINLCKQMANMTYSVTVTACNKLLIVERYWKSVVLLCVMAG